MQQEDHVGVTFEELPNKARKWRKLERLPHSNDPSPPLVVAPDRMPSVGVGICALDTSRLMGSQRVGIIGLPGTGKSTCCKSLLADLCYCFPIVNVFSGSEGDNPFYSHFVPKLFIQNKISQSRVYCAPP